MYPTLAIRLAMRWVAEAAVVRVRIKVRVSIIRVRVRVTFTVAEAFRSLL